MGSLFAKTQPLIRLHFPPFAPVRPNWLLVSWCDFSNQSRFHSLSVPCSYQPEPMADEADVKPASEPITLRLRDQSGEEVLFKVKKDTKMQKVKAMTMK